MRFAPFLLSPNHSKPIFNLNSETKYLRNTILLYLDVPEKCRFIIKEPFGYFSWTPFNKESNFDVVERHTLENIEEKNHKKSCKKMKRNEKLSMLTMMTK